jgi:general transcriptional corepressor TUP1
MLRHQLAEATRGKPGAGQPGMAGPPQHGGPSQQPPPSIAPGNGLISGIMSGGNQGGLAPPQQQHQQHGPPQEQQLGPQHQMAQGPPGLPAPPPHPSAQQQQQPPYQQPYPGAISNGMGPQPPQSTASPGPGRRGVGRPPNAVGPTTPQINTPVPYPGNAQSPQISHPTPDHVRMGGPRAPPQQPAVGNALGELDPDAVPAHHKKQGNDWLAIFNPQVQRVLDVDMVHSLAHDSVVCCVRFSYDGKYVATGCNRSAQIFDVATGEKVCVLEDQSVNDPMGNTDLYIRSVCFSPDGRYLATGAEDKLIRVRSPHRRWLSVWAKRTN